MFNPGPFPEWRSAETTVSDRTAIWTGTNYMSLSDPNPAEIWPGDIARALSRLDRFNGLSRRFYSVAEHSVNVANMARRAGEPPAVVAACLMHDAAEAYLGDVVSPLKIMLPDYVELENLMAGAIAARFGLCVQDDTWARVREYDLIALAHEKAALLPGAGPWPGVDEPRRPKMAVVGLSPAMAETEFLRAMRDLGVLA